MSIEPAKAGTTFVTIFDLTKYSDGITSNVVDSYTIKASTFPPGSPRKQLTDNGELFSW